MPRHKRIVVARAKATPKNPYGVAVGQVWDRYVDSRRPYVMVVTKVNLRGGYATCISESGRVTRTSLHRFSPHAGHLRLIVKGVDGFCLQGAATIQKIIRGLVADKVAA